MRRTSRTHRSILSAATMMVKCRTVVLTAFSPPVAVRVPTSKPITPCNFTSQKDPTDPSCWLCTVSPSPIRNEAVAASFVDQSMCLTMFFASPGFHFSSAASAWFLVSAPQICSSFLNPGTTVSTSTTTVNYFQ